MGLAHLSHLQLADSSILSDQATQPPKRLDNVTGDNPDISIPGIRRPGNSRVLSYFQQFYWWRLNILASEPQQGYLKINCIASMFEGYRETFESSADSRISWKGSFPRKLPVRLWPFPVFGRETRPSC
jgi:hypothetical protein